jgi:O-antigen/teichoic acid export membrane protein
MLKKIFSNTLAQLVAKFFGAGLTLLTTYYTIRLAGLDLYGDLTKILVLVAVGFTAIDFGLNAEGLRSSKTDVAMNKSLREIIFARLFLSLLVILALNVVVGALPGGYSPEIKSTFWLGSLAIIFQGIYTSGNAWFQYKLSYWRSTISVIVGSLVGTILTFYYLKYSPTLSNFVLATTLGYFSMAICTLLLLPPLDPKSWSTTSVFPVLRRSLVLGFILIASVIASKIDTVLLGVFRLSGEVGQYGFAYRIFDVILVLPVFVMNVIYPLSLRESASSHEPTLISQTTKYLALTGVVVAIVVWFAAPYLDLVKPGLIVSISVLRILALTLPLFYMTAPLMWGLIGKKRDLVVLGVYLAAALLNFLLNWLFIPSFGAVIAAWNTGITELCIFLSLLHFSRH